MTARVRLVFLALGVAILTLLLVSIDLGEVQNALRAADRGLLAVALALVIFNVWIKSVRWRFMVAQLVARPLSVWQAGVAVLAGVAAASLTPIRGLELAKPLLLRRSRGVALSSSTATVIVERLLDGAGLIVLCGLSLVLLPKGRAAEFRPVFAAMGILIAAMGLAVAIPSRLSGALTRLITALPLPDGLRIRAASLAEAFFQSLLVWRRPEQLWVAMAISVAAAAVEALRLTVVLAAMGMPVSVVQAMFAFSLANLVGVLTFVPGGVGVTELSMATILGLVAPGRTHPSALTAAVIIDRFLSYYLVVIAGSLVLLASGRAAPDERGNAGTE